jgi:hypothetical protein
VASEAASGELLISDDIVAVAGLQLDSLESRELTVRGREAHLKVRVARAETLSRDLIG